MNNASIAIIEIDPALEAEASTPADIVNLSDLSLALVGGGNYVVAL